MKYVIITTQYDINDAYMGKVFIWKRQGGPGLEDYEIEVKTLSKIDLDGGSIPVEKSQTLYFRTENNIKNVTPVYDKIQSLHIKLFDIKNKSKLEAMQLAKVHTILKEFEAGIYPSKTNFTIMNNIWKQNA